MNYFTSSLKNKTRLQAGYIGLTMDYDRFVKACDELKTDIWLDRAIGKQLDVIGKIVGVSRELPDAMYGVFFGYAGQPNSRGYKRSNGEGGARYRRPFESSKTETYSLADVEYRQVIKWKIHDNQSRGTIPDIQKSIKLILGLDCEVINGSGVVTVRVPKQTNSIFFDTLKNYITVSPGIRLDIDVIESSTSTTTVDTTAAKEAELNKNKNTQTGSTSGELVVSDKSKDADIKLAKDTPAVVNEDSDGISHNDASDKKTVIIQNAAVNDDVIEQQTSNGAVNKRFKYRAVNNAYNSSSNALVPAAGQPLVDDESGPYHIINFNGIEFGLGVVDNPNKAITKNPVILAKAADDGSVHVTFGTPVSAQAKKPSLTFLVSISDLNDDKSYIDSTQLNTNYSIQFDVVGDGDTSSKYSSVMGLFSKNAISMVSNLKMSTHTGGSNSDTYVVYSASDAKGSRPLQAYINIMDSVDATAKIFPNNPILDTSIISSNMKYGMVYGKFTVNMYITYRPTGETHMMSFLLTVDYQK